MSGEPWVGIDEQAHKVAALVAQGVGQREASMQTYLLTCESCPEQFRADELGCGCDGHTRCMACLIDCPSCAADLRDDMEAEGWRLK